MLINFIKNNLFIQNLVGKIHSIIPPVVSHNLAKYEALKKAMYQTALEHTTGDYLEFGVFTGSSFNYAMQINRKLKYLGDMQTSFYGFDSFKGLKENWYSSVGLKGISFNLGGILPKVNDNCR